MTTHTGSLPRPPAPKDQVRAAVQDVVGRQQRAGVGVVKDGEASKIAYSTHEGARIASAEAIHAVSASLGAAMLLFRRG